MSTTCALRLVAFLTMLLTLQIDTTNAVNSTSSLGNSRNEAVSDTSSPLTLKPRRLIGSSAPECGHTCGACSPCTIQIVSYECEEDLGSHAEACPLGYLCICHGKAFPIP